MKTYHEKLKDPRWQKKRLKVFERDGWKCTECCSKTETLHVHHKKYTSHDPWKAKIRDLSTLCENCHSIYKTLKLYPAEKYRTNGIGTYSNCGYRKTYCPESTDFLSCDSGNDSFCLGYFGIKKTRGKLYVKCVGDQFLGGPK